MGIGPSFPGHTCVYVIYGLDSVSVPLVNVASGVFVSDAM